MRDDGGTIVGVTKQMLWAEAGVSASGLVRDWQASSETWPTPLHPLCPPPQSHVKGQPMRTWEVVAATGGMYSYHIMNNMKYRVRSPAPTCASTTVPTDACVRICVLLLLCQRAVLSMRQAQLKLDRRRTSAVRGPQAPRSNAPQP